MPAALIEMAYLTNTTDQRLVRSDDYQNTVAQGIYDAVLRFRAYLEEQQPQ
jgi:N-acetylmuramoyl-L-alanine amidase